MSTYLNDLADFHKLHGYPRFCSLTSNPLVELGKLSEFSSVDHMLGTSLIALKCLSGGLKDPSAQAMVQGDSRAYRIHLMSEELGEFCEAMRNGDKVAAAHELTDLLYTVIGTFDTYDLPMAELFMEVHLANMTKKRRPDDPRMRDKGDTYIPPDIKRILEEAKMRRRPGISAGMREVD